MTGNTIRVYSGVMKLNDYITQQNLDCREFANQIDVSYETVRRYLTGERKPRDEIMTRIVLQTEGKVTPNDFFQQPQNNG